MISRQSVRVTYAHKSKRRRARTTLLSSPLEVLPPEMDDLTHTQMARRMLKRSRRVALAEQVEDKNVDHIREHLAKRIKHNQDRVSNLEPIGAPQDASDISFQTPFSSPSSVHKSAVSKPLVPEQLSPVPAPKRIMSRTSSKNLKENSTHSQTLASPFSSRPGSAASSPKHRGRGRPSRRVLRSSICAKSRTLSGVFKENVRRVLRKSSTVSLKDANQEPRTRFIKHRRYPSSPPAAYMRPQFAQEDWIVPPKALSRVVDDYDSILSPAGSVRSDALFYTCQPQSCSTPAIYRLRAPHARKNKTDGFFASFSLPKDPAEVGDLDVEMIDDTAPPRRQTTHLSGNNIFSTSDEFTIGSPSATNKDEIGADGQDEALARSIRQVSTVLRSQAGRSLAGSFIAEYDIPLSDMACSPVSTTATKMLGPEGVPKTSVGEHLVNFPGTSSADGGTLFIRRRRRPRTPRSPDSPRNATAHCPPSSPASDLAQGVGSLNICGDPDTHSDRETRRPSVHIPPLTRSHSLQDALESTTKKSVKRVAARNRAGTIRASEFVKQGPGGSSSGGALGLTASSLSNVRRTRSGTVVGPDSTLATKTAASKGTPATGLAAVQSGSESESDDELLLKSPWQADVVYLGVAAPLDKDADSDDLNLRPDRPRLRRR